MTEKQIKALEQKLKEAEQRIDDLNQIMKYLSLLPNNDLHILETFIKATTLQYTATIHPLQLVKQ